MLSLLTWSLKKLVRQEENLSQSISTHWWVRELLHWEAKKSLGCPLPPLSVEACLPKAIVLSSKLWYLTNTFHVTCPAWVKSLGDTDNKLPSWHLDLPSPLLSTTHIHASDRTASFWNFYHKKSGVSSSAALFIGQDSLCWPNRIKHLKLLRTHLKQGGNIFHRGHGAAMSQHALELGFYVRDVRMCSRRCPQSSVCPWL